MLHKPTPFHGQVVRHRRIVEDPRRRGPSFAVPGSRQPWTGEVKVRDGIVVSMAVDLLVGCFEDHEADDLSEALVELQAVIDPLLPVVLAHAESWQDEEAVWIEGQDDVPV